MRALVYTRPDEVVYRVEPDPVPGPGESLVRLEAAGICGSDMHAYHGHDPRRVPPMILGHEGAGRVVAGPGRGTLAVLDPLVTCGRCPACTGGRSNLCPERTQIGMQRQGALAELVAVPEQNLIPIPDGLDPAHAALTEPAGNVVHALGLAARAAHRPLAEGRALVLGAGAIGLLGALFLSAYGCRRIRLGETNAKRRESAARTGAADVFDPSADGVPDAGSYDLVFDAVGGAATRAAAVAAVKPGGIVVHIGLMDTAGEFDFRRLTLAEIILIGTYSYTRNDLEAGLAALGSGTLGDLAWVETRPLADGARAFDDLARGRSGAGKVVLRP